MGAREGPGAVREQGAVAVRRGGTPRRRAEERWVGGWVAPFKTVPPAPAPAKEVCACARARGVCVCVCVCVRARA